MYIVHIIGVIVHCTNTVQRLYNVLEILYNVQCKFAVNSCTDTVHVLYILHVLYIVHVVLIVQAPMCTCVYFTSVMLVYNNHSMLVSSVFSY